VALSPLRERQRERWERAGRRAEETFAQAKAAQTQYERQLRSIAGQVARIIKAHAPEAEDAPIPPGALARIEASLSRYAEAIAPWARATAARMISEVDRRNRASWMRYTEGMSAALRAELQRTQIGETVQELLAQQVDLITSLPWDAARRVQEQSLEALASGARYPEHKEEIEGLLATTHPEATEEWLSNRATLIARTETARTASLLTQARATSIGAESYIWRTAGDARVRPSHRALNGHEFRWDDPPVSDPPDYRAHPGTIWNCFPGSTKVSLANGCQHLWRYWYEGPLVVIEHEAGSLPLTPNHPILTDLGWVAGNDLDAGDYIIQTLQKDRLGLAEDEDQGQPTFDEVFAALDVCFGRETHSGLLSNFHGDIPQHNVDHIRTHDLLSGYRVAASLQRISDDAFTGADRRVIEAVVGSVPHVGISDFPSGLDEAFAGLRSHGLHSDDISLRGSAALDTMSLKNAIYDYALTSIPQADRQDAFSGPISGYQFSFGQIAAAVVSRTTAIGKPDLYPASAELLADVVRGIANSCGGILHCGASFYKRLRVRNKRLRDFSGHVYTMQSRNGWYSVTPAGIATKNCRCVALPIIPEG
jgi:SPP1 gp7 family putative phage head morphogenesis protein